MTAHAFSLRGLGYVGVFADEPDRWQSFGTEVCGLVPALTAPGAGSADSAPSEGSVFLKMDQRQWRLAIHPTASEAEKSAKEGLAYLGFEVATEGEFAIALETIESRGVAIREGSEAERAARGVSALAVFEDPAGHRLEIFATPVIDQDFRSAEEIEFLTGELGMGHVVLYVPEIEAALAFYRDVLGFRRTDFMRFGPGGMGIHFLRCTRRHHSIALLQIGDLSGLQHLMLEATTLDGVGKALDRAHAAGVPISSSLGRHRNDKTVSFYMKGPSGFDVEIGWDGVLVGDDWVEHEFAGGGDDWGHAGLDAESLKPDA
ncbi:MAG: VOC family protein [Myxococcota bacterium]